MPARAVIQSVRAVSISLESVVDIRASKHHYRFGQANGKNDSLAIGKNDS